MTRTFTIVTNGSITNLAPLRRTVSGSDLIVCVDGAADTLIQAGITPHVLLGDLDSIAPADKQYLEERQVAVERHPVEKDKTDTELALDYCLAAGAQQVHLFGATGTRLDHSLANVFLLHTARQKGIRLILHTDYSWAQLVDAHLTVHGEPGDLLSLLPLSDRVTGVTLRGCRYPLDNAVITRGSTLGISNELLDQEADISVTGGELLAVFTALAQAD